MASRSPPAVNAPATPKKINTFVGEHALPDPMGGGEVAPLERDPLHPPQQLVGRRARRDLEGLDGYCKKT